MRIFYCVTSLYLMLHVYLRIVLVDLLLVVAHLALLCWILP